MDHERVSDCVWIGEKLYEAQTQKKESLTKQNVCQRIIKKYLWFITKRDADV